MKNVLFFLTGLLAFCIFFHLLCYCSVFAYIIVMTIEGGIATAAFLWMVFLRPWPVAPKSPKMKFKYLTLTGILILALIWTGTAKPTVTPVPDPKTQPQLIAECGVALGLLAAGVVIVVGLNKMCNKLSPPPPEPPPEPPPIFFPPWNPSVQPMVSGGSPIQLNFDDSGVQEYDVSSYGWTDPQGYPWYAMFKTTVQSSPLQSGAPWTNVCSVVGWCSYFNVGTVWSDANGVPFLTNICARVNRFSTNNCYAPIDLSGPRKFFRLMSAP